MTSRTTAHDTAIAYKARRAVNAITSIAQTLVDDPDFPEAHTLADGLRTVRGWLFDQPDSAWAARCWRTVGVQELLDAGRTTAPEGDIPTYTTTRPYIAVLLDMRIESATATDDPFAGLAQ